MLGNWNGQTTTLHRCESRRSRLVHKRGQGGFSLIEALVSTVLVATILMAIISTVLFLVTSSAMQKRQVVSGLRSTDIGEQIDRLPYRCGGTAAQYAGDIASLNIPGYTAELLSVEYLVSRTDPSAQFVPTPKPTSCANDNGVQKFMIKVTGIGDTNMTSELTFVKRDTTCRQANAEVGATC